MRESFIAPHLVAASSCLVPPEIHDATQSVGWLHGGCPPDTNEGYLVFIITLWHICSLAQLVLSKPHRLTGPSAPISTTHTRCYPSSPALRTSDPNDRLLCDLVQVLEVPPLVEGLAATWSSRTMRVSVLTSPNDQCEVWLCDGVQTTLEDSDTALTRACVGYAQDTGVDSNEHILAWHLDAHYGLSDNPSVGGLNVACDNGSTVVTVRMDRATTELAFLEDSCWRSRSHDPSNLGHPDSGSSTQSQKQAQAGDGRTPLTQPTNVVVQSQSLHEAHGVGVIVKALVQQNAGASLFLRTVVCVSALLYLAYSILVLGQRPSSVGCPRC